MREIRRTRGLFTATLPRIVVIALGGILAAALSLQVSLAGVYRSSRPQLALRVAPSDAAARAKLAERIVDAEANDLRGRARALALDALRRDPLQPGATRVLALVDRNGRLRSGNQAFAMMEQAQRLSKRDLATHRWLIDYYSRRGDRKAAIGQLDMALRSSEGSRAQLFPLLDAMSFDRPTGALLMQTLADSPNWTHDFAVFMIDGGRNLDFARLAASNFLNPSVPEDHDRFIHLVQRFVDDGRFDSAWSLYNDPAIRLRRGSVGLVSNGGFERIEDGSPFDWAYAEEPDLWAARAKVGGGRWALEIGASNGRAGVVARQVLHLPQATYRMTLVAGRVPAQQSDRPNMQVTCTGRSGEPLAQLRAANSGASGARFTVPPGCPFQQIAIEAVGQDALPEALPWIDDITIAKVG